MNFNQYKRMCYKEYVRKYGTNTVTLPHFRYLTITPASRIYTLQNPSHKSQQSHATPLSSHTKPIHTFFNLQTPSTQSHSFLLH